MLAKMLSSQLRRNAVSGVVTAGCNSTATFIVYPIYVSCLGLDVYGVWVLLATITQIAIFGDFGVSQATTKLVAEEYAKNNLAGVQRYITSSLMLLGLGGSLALVFLGLVSGILADSFGLSVEHAEIVRLYLPWVSAVALYIVLGNVCCSALSGIGRMDLANYIQSLGRCLGAATSAAFLLGGMGIVSLLIGVFFSSVLTHIGSVVVFRRISGVNLLRLEWPQRFYLKRILRYGGGVLSASLVTLALNPFNKILLCKFSGVASVPIYDIAFYSARQLKALAESALRSMVPEVSRLAATESKEFVHQIAHLNRRALRLVLMLSVPSYLLVLLLIKPLLTLWVGPDLADPLAPVMSVMLLGSFVSLLSVPSYYTLLGVGRVRSILSASLVKIATNFAICLIILAFTRSVTPLSLAFAVLIALSATTLYLFFERRRFLEASLRGLPQLP